ncbi:prostasin-like [Scomber scombrus]|uniref:Prostasin-like n=1 Tax=Scomber scombrus TaxID=13677 RepID=A0AAV1PK94_SCOSC
MIVAVPASTCHYRSLKLYKRWRCQFWETDSVTSLNGVGTVTDNMICADVLAGDSSTPPPCHNHPFTDAADQMVTSDPVSNMSSAEFRRWMTAAAPSGLPPPVITITTTDATAGSDITTSDPVSHEHEMFDLFLFWLVPPSIHYRSLKLTEVEVLWLEQCNCLNGVGTITVNAFQNFLDSQTFPAPQGNSGNIEQAGRV